MTNDNSPRPISEGGLKDDSSLSPTSLLESTSSRLSHQTRMKTFPASLNSGLFLLDDDDWTGSTDLSTEFRSARSQEECWARSAWALEQAIEIVRDDINSVEQAKQ